MQALGNKSRDVLLFIFASQGCLAHIRCSVDIWWCQRIPAKYLNFLDCFGEQFFLYAYLFCFCFWKRTSLLELLSNKAGRHTGIIRNFFFLVHGSFTLTLSVVYRAVFPGRALETVIQRTIHSFQKHELGICLESGTYVQGKGYGGK